MKWSIADGSDLQFSGVHLPDMIILNSDLA